MKLRLERDIYTAESTTGTLSIDGEFFCYTLEDPVHDGPKVPGSTAIPEGTYEIAITFSARFGRLLPLLLSVPGFDGVRIHWGNHPRDTEGCILVGSIRGDNWVGNSRSTMERLFEAMRRAVMREKMEIEVTHAAEIADSRSRPPQPVAQQKQPMVT